MIDHRLYRAGFVPALATVVLLLFALTAPPDPLESAVATAEFDGSAATRIARQIVEIAPERPPGSAGDAEVADLVDRHFHQVDSGEVSEQSFTGQFDGNDVDMRNVILTLPGDSTRSIVLMAPRDSAGSPGAASSAAATGMLLQLVNQLRTQSHAKTFVFVSTDGSTAGAAGAREFAGSYAGRDEIDTVIDLWQPGYANPHPPFVLESSAGRQSPPAQLARTVERVLSEQTTHKQASEGLLPSLAGLAIPSGLGEPAVLIQSGLDAVGLSSAGARPLPESQDQLANLSSSEMGDFGRTALLAVAAIDESGEPLEHGPATYVPMAGNLVPGWTLSLLALALLLPAALAAADGIRRGVRRNQQRQRHMPVSGPKAPSPAPGAQWAIMWGASRALPLIAGLFFFYLLGLVGLVAEPPFPFDPNLFGVGPGQVIVMLFCAVVVGATYYALRGWRVPASLPSHAAVPALGAVSVLAVFGAWLANPYLGLLLVPTAHVWVTCAGRRGVLPWAIVAAAALISLVPAIAALDHVSGELALGASAPWLLLLMVSDGQIGFGTIVASSLVLGSLLGILAVSIRGRVPPPDALDASPITSSVQDDDKANES